MTVHLPTLGAHRDEPRGVVRSPAELRPAPRPTLALSGARPGASLAGFAAELVAALAARGPVDALCVVRAGVHQGDLGTRLRGAGAGRVVSLSVTAERAPDEIERAHLELTPGGTLVVVGNDWPALYRPRALVLLTEGLPRPVWVDSARALVDRVDLELADPRPGVARELAARWCPLKEGAARP